MSIIERLLKPKGGARTLKDLDLYVRFSILMALVFTVIILVIFAVTGLEPTTLITCFFAMFGGEIFFCAVIKLFKIKQKDDA